MDNFETHEQNDDDLMSRMVNICISLQNRDLVGIADRLGKNKILFKSRSNFMRLAVRLLVNMSDEQIIAAKEKGLFGKPEYDSEDYFLYKNGHFKEDDSEKWKIDL